jgi:hypothetical protein
MALFIIPSIHGSSVLSNTEARKFDSGISGLGLEMNWGGGQSSPEYFLSRRPASSTSAFSSIKPEIKEIVVGSGEHL